MLRDVLGLRTAETADIPEVTIESAASALKRARATLAVRGSAGEADREPPPALGSPAERELVRRLTEAFAAEDVDAVVGSLTEGVWLIMPTLPFEYQGRDAVRWAACPASSPTKDEQPRTQTSRDSFR